MLSIQVDNSKLKKIIYVLLNLRFPCNQFEKIVRTIKTIWNLSSENLKIRLSCDLVENRKCPG